MVISYMNDHFPMLVYQRFFGSNYDFMFFFDHMGSNHFSWGIHHFEGLFKIGKMMVDWGI